MKKFETVKTIETKIIEKKTSEVEKIEDVNNSGSRKLNTNIESWKNWGWKELNEERMGYVRNNNLR